MKNKIMIIVIKFINKIIPKTSNKIIFRSEPDYSDNAKALYSYINNNYNDEYDLVWIVKNDEVLNKLIDMGIKAYKRNSIKGLLEFCRAKYIVSTHAQFANLKNKKQIYINLWHGMVLKNIGFLEKKENVGEKYLISEKKKFERMDHIISTSKTMRLVMSSVFYTDVRKVYITGQPRNDYLFCKESKIKLSKCVKNIDFSNYKKVIIYVPTYRVGIGKKDGNAFNDNILNLDKYNEEKLNDFLNKNNYLLLVKFHPFEESIFKKGKFSNIRIIESSLLSENLITLNEILNVSDLLITDYSSVYFDYLLLNKPIIFTNTDEKQYMKDRGFIFDNPDFWRPGAKINNLEDLVKEIYKALNNSNYYKEEREIIGSLVNEYCDGNSSKRVYDTIFRRDNE